MVNPKTAHGRIRMRQGQPIRRQRMREQRRIDVQPQAAGFGKGYPRFKVLRFEFVAFNDFAIGHGVDGVNINFVLARHQ
ncbi:hypothetical protein SDC9_166814 [bioreactor metagenome]|uniref:Uncharacterized protein n=1 Tax=bioreactor metagenome TaxID=1076179 RepID=A0A645FYE0_9ZZZZ